MTQSETHTRSPERESFVEKELASLRRKSVNDLRAQYAEVFGESTNARHKEWLIKRIIWRLQTVAEGDLTERARRRAEELANDADIRLQPPKPPEVPEPVPTPAPAVMATAENRPDR